jgi:hypothetical protein
MHMLPLIPPYLLSLRHYCAQSLSRSRARVLTRAIAFIGDDEHAHYIPGQRRFHV